MICLLADVLQVHVDRYQMGLYRSLAQGSGSRGASEAPGLCGFELGNRVAAGCLSESTDIRIHSCERGVSCVTARQPGTVYIIPIVNRTSDGAELPEVGAGGGIGDLYQTHELELPDERALSELEKLCFQHIRDEQVLVQMRQTLLEAFMSKKKALSLDWYGINEEEDISLERMIATLGRGLAEGRCSKPEGSADKDSKRLPNTIVCSTCHQRRHFIDWTSVSHTHVTRLILNYARSSPLSDQRIYFPAPWIRHLGTRTCLCGAYSVIFVRTASSRMMRTCGRFWQRLEENTGGRKEATAMTSSCHVPLKRLTVWCLRRLCKL